MVTGCLLSTPIALLQLNGDNQWSTIGDSVVLCVYCDEHFKSIRIFEVTQEPVALLIAKRLNHNENLQLQELDSERQFYGINVGEHERRSLFGIVFPKDFDIRSLLDLVNKSREELLNSLQMASQNKNAKISRKSAIKRNYVPLEQKIKKKNIQGRADNANQSDNNGQFDIIVKPSDPMIDRLSLEHALHQIGTHKDQMEYHKKEMLYWQEFHKKLSNLVQKGQ
jgi:hypothetical protein